MVLHENIFRIKQLIGLINESSNYYKSIAEIILESKTTKIVDKIIKHVFPLYDTKEVKITSWKTNDEISYYEFFSKDGGIRYGAYNPVSKTLHLHFKIMNMLEAVLGEDYEKFTVDWFNDEFGLDASNLDI